MSAYSAVEQAGKIVLDLAVHCITNRLPLPRPGSIRASTAAEAQRGHQRMWKCLITVASLIALCFLVDCATYHKVAPVTLPNNPSAGPVPVQIPKQDRYERTVTSFDARKGPPMPNSPARTLVANVIVHTNVPMNHLTFTITTSPGWQPVWTNQVLQSSIDNGRSWQDVTPWTNYPLVLLRTDFASGSWFRNRYHQ